MKSTKILLVLGLLFGLYGYAAAVPTTPTVAPLGFPACPDPSTRVIILFTYLDSNGNQPASTTYNIKRCSGAACTPTSLATGVTSQAYLDTDRTANTLYRYSYSVTDGSGTSGDSPIVDITTAATDDNLVRYPTTVSANTDGMRILFGPMTCATTTTTAYDPFTWLSSNQDAQAAYWKGRTPKHGPGVLTGTISASTGSTALTGTGTAFLQEINTDDSVNTPTTFHGVWAAGVFLGTVASCASNTACTLDSNSAANASGAAGATWNAATDQDTVYLNNIYYDLGWNMYINAFRQGTIADFEDARWVVDSWFSGRNRQGRGTVSFGTPRGSSLGGLFARALDGRSEIWQALEVYIFEKRGEWITNHLADTFIYSVRDQGYMLKYMNFLNRLLPNSFSTSDGSCTTVANCGGTYTDGATLRSAIATSITDFVAETEDWQSDSGLWLVTGSGGAGNSEDTAGALGFGQTLLMPLLLDALGDIANNTNLTSTPRNSARLQVLKGANYLGMIAYNTQRVHSQPTLNHRANWYAHGGGTIPNPEENRHGAANALLPTGAWSIGSTRQNGCTVPNTFAHAYALSGKAIYKDMGMEYMNSLWAETGENTGGTGDGEKNLAWAGDGKNYSECYRASMQMLARNLESPSSLGAAPVADAGSDVTLTGSQNVVTLSSGSGTCANTPCTVKWAMRVGPQAYAWNVVLPYIFDDTAHTPTIVNAEPGVYTLVKVQTDALGMADEDTMQLTVPGSSTFKPTLQCIYAPDGAYPIQKATGTTSLTITCTAASAGASETFSWVWGTPLGPKNLSAATVTSPTSASSVVTLPGDGDYLFPVTATGNTSGLARTHYMPFTVHRAGNAVPTLSQNTLPVVLSGLDQTLGSGVTSTYVHATIVDSKAWQIYVYNASPPSGWVINPDGNLNIRGPGTISWSCTNGATVATSTDLRTQVSNWTSGSTVCTPTYNDGLEGVAGNSVTITNGGVGPTVCRWHTTPPCTN